MVWVERGFFQKLKGNLFQKNGTTKSGVPIYQVSFPKDLKVGELPAIISRVNSFSYNNSVLPISLEKNDTIFFLKSAISKLLFLQKKTTQKKDKKILQKAINKYIKLFEQNFPGENINISSEISFFNNQRRRKAMIELSQLQDDILVKDYERFIDKWLADNFKDGLDRSFFEHGKKMIFDFMKSFDSADYKLAKSKKQLNFRSKDFIDTIEQNLKAKLNVKEIKQELKKIRKGGDIKKISDKELQIATVILETLYNNYPWNSTLEGNEITRSSSPSKIIETKEMVCVGKSILAHVFLEYIGIKHYGASLPQHTALVLEISDGQKYYYDPLNLSYPKKIQLNEDSKSGIYYNIPGLYHSKEEFNKIHIGDPETYLMGSINNNSGITFYENKDYDVANIMLKKAFQQNPKSIDFFKFQLHILTEIGDYEGVLKKLVDLKKSGTDMQYYYRNNYLKKFYYKRNLTSDKGTLPYNLYEYIDYIYNKCKDGFEKEYLMGILKGPRYFEKALQYRTDDSEKYIKIAKLLHSKPNLALKGYNKAIKIKPNNELYKILRGNFFIKQGNIEEAKRDFLSTAKNIYSKNIIQVLNKFPSITKEEVDKKIIQIGLNMQKQENFKDQFHLFKQAQEIEHNIEFLRRLPSLAYTLQDYKSVIKYSDETIKFLKFYGDAYKNEYYYHIKAAALYNLGDLKKSLDLYLFLKKKFPGNKNYQNAILDIQKQITIKYPKK